MTVMYERDSSYGKSADPETLFWQRVDFLSEAPCFVWRGQVRADGYGMASHRGSMRMAHRVALEHYWGFPPPSHLDVDHICRNRACVNPSHLEPVTHQENVQRAWDAQTHCRNGHAYTEENTRRDKFGYRVCRTCVRAARRRCNERRKEARRVAQG